MFSVYGLYSRMSHFTLHLPRPSTNGGAGQVDGVGVKLKSIGSFFSFAIKKVSAFSF